MTRSIESPRRREGVEVGAGQVHVAAHVARRSVRPHEERRGAKGGEHGVQVGEQDPAAGPQHAGELRDGLGDRLEVRQCQAADDRVEARVG